MRHRPNPNLLTEDRNRFIYICLSPMDPPAILSLFTNSYPVSLLIILFALLVISSEYINSLKALCISILFFPLQYKIHFLVND